MHADRFSRGRATLRAAAILLLLATSAAAQRETLASSPRVSSRIGTPPALLSVGREELSLAARDDAAWQELVRQVEADGDRIVRFLPERLTIVLRVPAARFASRLAALRSDPRVAHAHPVHYIGEDPDHENARYLLTPDVVVAFAPDLAPRRRRQLLREAKLVFIRDLEGLAGLCLARTLEGEDPLAACAHIARHPEVRAAHPDWLRPLGLRDTFPADPLFGNQWHLLNTGQGGGTPGADIAAVPAWDLALGTGITIAVIDTGVDGLHLDIAQTPSGFNPQLGPGPGQGQDVAGHGTRVAGVAAAAGGNGYQVAGVAWQATVMPIRLLNGSGYGTPSEEAACFVHAADHGADVITNSWGPDGVPFPLPFVVEQAFIHATDNGRGGLGCPIFWAAGNGAEDIAGDDYVGSAYTIAVGAMTNLGVRASYSDFGSALDLVAPSSGGTRAINTTDLGGSTTLMFGGTSASAPQAAGVAALMLSANANLDWTSVRDLMRDAATQIQPALAGYDAAGHSPLYGHGLLNAHAAVQAALAAAPTPPSLIIYSYGIGDINIQIADMPPFAEWALGISSQLYAPIGTGPLFGVGMDALQTFTLPAGTIPFHFWADATGGYSWGAIGVPPGIVFQAAVVAVQLDGSLAGSNVMQVAY